MVLRSIQLVALGASVALGGCGSVETSGPTHDGGGSSTHATSTASLRVDAGGIVDAGRHDVRRAASSSASASSSRSHTGPSGGHDAAVLVDAGFDSGFVCTPHCTSMLDCNETCESIADVTWCCDLTTNLCFQSADPGGTCPGPQGDSGTPQCTTSCTSAANCNDTCPPEFETAYCCDVSTGRCFVADDGPTCPLNGNGCPAGGCPAGQMCVYNFLGPDPPLEPVASCYTLPAACAHTPTCACLATAGVCGPDGGGGPSCEAIDAGAYLDCIPF